MSKITLPRYILVEMGEDDLVEALDKIATLTTENVTLKESHARIKKAYDECTTEVSTLSELCFDLKEENAALKTRLEKSDMEESFEQVESCKYCGTVILPEGKGAHHSASCLITVAYERGCEAGREEQRKKDLGIATTRAKECYELSEYQHTCKGGTCDACRGDEATQISMAIERSEG